MIGLENQSNGLQEMPEKRLSEAEGRVLYELAKSLSPGEVIVEIANQVGNSTAVLLEGTGAGEGSPIFNVAVHGRADVTGGVMAKQYSSSFGPALMVTASHNKGLFFLDARAVDVARRWTEVIGLLVIIGLEKYEEIRQALFCFSGYLSTNASVAVHDSRKPGAARAIREFTGDIGNLMFNRYAESLALMTVDKCIHHWIIDGQSTGICRYCRRKRKFMRIREEFDKPKLNRMVIGSAAHGKTEVPKKKRR